MKIILISICFIFLFANINLTAQTQGEILFKQNKSQEAILMLEEEVNNGSASADAYNYLGLAYYQIGDYEKSVEAFARGLKVPSTNKKILSFNQGNSYYALGNFEAAVKSFSLAFAADSTYYPALLNRANSYLMAGNLEAALGDYKKYIACNPYDEQADIINQMINAILSELNRLEEEAKMAEIEAAKRAEEEKRIAAELEKQRQEEEARRAEEERIAAEKKAEEERLAAERKAEEERILAEKKAAEAERRRKLLEEVANSLQNTDSTNMSSGAEDLIEYEMESELD